MDTPSEHSWDDIEAVLYQEWVEEQALLAVLEAMGELDESDELKEADEAEDADEGEELDAFPLDELMWGRFSH